jgi:hypothetical protein
MRSNYILDENRNPIAVDFMTWAVWFENSKERVVAQTNVGNVTVSTVFIGLDHNFDPFGPPHLFETMIFRNGDGGDCWRCTTWQEAEAQHARAVEYVRALAESE